jgi:hypothetical protein
MILQRMISNHLKIWFKKRFWAGLLLAQFLLFYFLSKIEFFIILFNQFFEFKKEIHQKISSVFTFSVGDLLYLFSILLMLYLLFKIIQGKSRNKYILLVLVILNLFYFVYQSFWGMLYFQKPISEKLPDTEVNVVKIKKLTLYYLKRCKKTRKLVQQDQNGIFKITDHKTIKKEILNNQKLLPKFISQKKGTDMMDFKESNFKSVLNYTGILGYYNPFSAEAQYNPKLPATYIPFTLSHESAHQLGFAREQEANFIGYLIGINSKNLDLRYSTEYFVLKSLLNSLIEEDSSFVAEVINQYSPEMKRDRLAEKYFFNKHESFLNDIFAYTNDLFLKGNQQEGSITYSYFVNLLINYQNIAIDSK